MSVHSLTNEVGMGPRSHVLLGEDAVISSMPSSDTGVDENMVLLMGLGLVTRIGVDDCKSDLILIIFSLKKCPNMFKGLVLTEHHYDI